MNGFEEFKNFCIKYKGAILGGLVAILVLCTGILDLIVSLVIIFLGMLLGNYIQRNKEVVKENLKKFIDKF